MPYYKIQCTFCGGECEPFLPHSCSYTAGVRMVLPLDRKHIDIIVPANETAVATTREQELVGVIARLKEKLNDTRFSHLEALDCLADFLQFEHMVSPAGFERHWIDYCMRARKLLSGDEITFYELKAKEPDHAGE